jgi:signal transduction histidine kinase
VTAASAAGVADPRARIAWGLAVVTALLVAADVLVSAQAVSLISETAVAVHGFPFVHGAVLGCAVMGALIISRYSRHPIGWLLSLVGLMSAFSLLTEAYAFWVLEADGPGPHTLGGISAWLSTLTGGQLAIAGIALMYLLAPDGHLLSRRWRYAVWAIGVGAAMFLGAILTAKPSSFDLVNQSETIGPVRGVMLSVGFLVISSGLVAAVVSMLQRLRQSSGVQRQQLRLIALSAALIVAGILILFLVQAVNGGRQTWLSGTPLVVAYFLLPILFATAVLRYRLYDLDLIINRSVVLLVGTAFAAVGYITLVVAVGQLVEGRAGGFWLSLLATTVVALAFQPLRRSVVRFANRLAYGERAKPYEALADFSQDLTRLPSESTLLPAVAEAAGRAVSARGASATLDVAGNEPVTATWGTLDEAPVHLVPVRHDDIELGRITVALPRGRELRPSDEQLLSALADQTAVAFRNTALAAQLTAQVAELDRTTTELAASRLRLIEADDAARRSLEAAIAREVLPYLASLPTAIERARDAVARHVPENTLDLLIAGTNQALESLRELTRGLFPSQLTRSGLEPAVRSLLARRGLGAAWTVEGPAGRRFSPRVEAALFFCCAEASGAGSGVTAIELVASDEDLVALRIAGVRRGGVDLAAMTDRVEAAGGTVLLMEDGLALTIPVEADRASALLVDPAGRGPSLR